MHPVLFELFEIWRHCKHSSWHPRPKISYTWPKCNDLLCQSRLCKLAWLRTSSSLLYHPGPLLLNSLLLLALFDAFCVSWQLCGSNRWYLTSYLWLVISKKETNVFPIKYWCILFLLFSNSMWSTRSKKFCIFMHRNVHDCFPKTKLKIMCCIFVQIVGWEKLWFSKIQFCIFQYTDLSWCCAI